MAKSGRIVWEVMGRKNAEEDSWKVVGPGTVLKP